MELIDKNALVEKINTLMFDEFKYNSYDEATGFQSALTEIEEFIDTLEVKEVDLELITGWFDHIAQIADDRMTLTGQRMTDSHALDEIKCLAKNSSEFITKHYKAQKGE